MIGRFGIDFGMWLSIGLGYRRLAENLGVILHVMVWCRKNRFGF